MNLKSRFESNPAVFGLSLIVLGFVGGFGARGYFVSAAPSPIPATLCNVQGAEALAQGHNARMQELQKSLASFESQASYEGNISSYQERYRASADRVRKDIAQEVDAFRASAAALSNKCAG